LEALGRINASAAASPERPPMGYRRERKITLLAALRWDAFK